MGKNIEISEKIEKYINNFSFKLNSVQKEIIDYNNTLGNEKRMQVAISQCHFCLLYTSPSPRDEQSSRMPSSA